MLRAGGFLADGRHASGVKSFQAYLDNVQAKTGKTPDDFIAEAREMGLTQSRDIVAWLKADYGLGTGHARAIDYVIRYGPEYTFRESTDPDREITGTLILDGSSLRKRERRRLQPRARLAGTDAVRENGRCILRFARRRGATPSKTGRR